METSGINAITHLLTTKLNDKKKKKKNELGSSIKRIPLFTLIVMIITRTQILSTDTHFYTYTSTRIKKSKLIKTEATSY